MGLHSPTRWCLQRARGTRMTCVLERPVLCTITTHMGTTQRNNAISTPKLGKHTMLMTGTHRHSANAAADTQAVLREDSPGPAARGDAPPPPNEQQATVGPQSRPSKSQWDKKS